MSSIRRHQPTSSWHRSLSDRKDEEREGSEFPRSTSHKEFELIMNDYQPRLTPPMPRRPSVRMVTGDLFSGVDCV